MPILEARDVHYAYETHRVLRGVSLALERGKLYAILGPSGCGKTTLLSLLGGLDSPQGGHILFQGKDIAETGLGRHRRRHVAFVFQSYNLIDYLTPTENVALASKLPPLPLLERLGLTKEAASSSGWPSPGPWPARPRSSWQMSPPAAWTRTPPRASPPFCGKAPTRWASAWWWSPTPGNLPGRPTWCSA